MNFRTSAVMCSIISCAVFLIIWLQCLSFANANATKVCYIDSKPHPQGICGRKIDEVLSLLCGKGGLKEKYFRKRSASMAPDIDSQSFLEVTKQNAQAMELQPSLADILVTKEAAYNFLDKRASYYQSGVACECCYNSCTIKELTLYCKNPVKALSQFGL